MQLLVHGLRRLVSYTQKQVNYRMTSSEELCKVTTKLNFHDVTGCCSVSIVNSDTDRLHMTPLTTIFDVKQWKRVRMYTCCAQLSANDSLSRVHDSSKMAANASLLRVVLCSPINWTSPLVLDALSMPKLNRVLESSVWYLLANSHWFNPYFPPVDLHPTGNPIVHLL